MKIDACLSNDENYWETPTDLFNELNNKYHFTLDHCSSIDNHKCDKFYTIEDNGLRYSWKNERVFCNPPYGKIDTGLWVKKAHEESKKALVVVLIPSRTDTKWFHEYIYNKHEIVFLKGRLKFNGEAMKDKDGKPQSAPFPSMLVIMKPEDHEDWGDDL